MADTHLNNSSPAKVVSIDSAYLKAPMPTLFVQLKDCGQKAAMPLLQALFDHVDDALFEMADKADSNAAQNMYFESMREVRLKRRGMELAFLKSIEGAFSVLANVESAQVESHSAVELGSADLSVVSNDELDELMASGSLISKAEKRFVEPLSLLVARINSLLPAKKLSVSTIPLGPAVICQAFIDACHALDTDVNTKLVLFKLFDRYVIDGLGELYEACNQLFVRAGVMPETTATSALSTGAVGVQSSASQASEVFSSLQKLLQSVPQVTGSNQGVGLQASGMAPQIPRESLMALLSHVQHQLAVTPSSGSAVSLDLQQAINTLFLEQLPGQVASIGKLEDDTINLVSMLFQFVLEDRNLAEPIKVLLARMQIPIVKVAMEDKSFFSKGGHPARKLLNALATACLGWQEPKKIETDPLYKKISSIVNNLLEDFDGDGEVFQTILADFNDFLTLEKRRASLIEQRTLDAEDGKAKSELAREAVKAVLQDKLMGQSLPPVVMTLLQEAWSNVLFLLYLKEGVESEQWQQGITVVDELLWSVAPMHDSSDRKRLLKLIPQLLKSLRNGLSQVAFNPFKMNTLFDELENIHLAQLKQPSPVVSESELVDNKLAESEIIDPAIDSVTTVVTPTAAATEFESKQRLELEELDDLVSDELNALAGDIDNHSEANSTIDSSHQTLDQMLENKSVAPQAVTTKSVESLDSELTTELGELDELEGFGEEEGPLQGKSSEPDVPSIHLQRVDILNIGSWLEMLQDDGSRLRCRLAAVIRGTGKYIFVNRAGMKVSEHTRESLADAIESGEVSLLDDGLLFDRALESVIGNLREMKSTAG